VAEKTGYSERAVQRHVRQLEKLGLLVLAGQGQHGTNSYDFPLTKRPDGSPYLSIQASQGCQNVTPDKMTGVTLVTPEEMSPEEMSPKPKEVLKDLVVVVKDDPKEKNVFAIYESNFGAMTSMLKDSLIDLEKTYSAEWLIAAMQEALLAEARNLRYVEAVLRNWHTHGFKAKKITPAKGKPNGLSRSINPAGSAPATPPSYTAEQRAAAEKVRAARAGANVPAV